MHKKFGSKKQPKNALFLEAFGIAPSCLLWELALCLA